MSSELLRLPGQSAKLELGDTLDAQKHSEIVLRFSDYMGTGQGWHFGGAALGRWREPLHEALVGIRSSDPVAGGASGGVLCMRMVSTVDFYGLDVGSR